MSESRRASCLHRPRRVRILHGEEGHAPVRRLDMFLLAFALLPAACGEPRIGREQAIAIAQAHVRQFAPHGPTVVVVAYERRSTWMVKFLFRGGGGTGGGPNLEIDKRTGKVLMVYAFQ